METVESRDIDVFLDRHPPVRSAGMFEAGKMFGRWWITAFLGRGGCGEVYRVVHSENGSVAALKVFARNVDGANDADSVARERFCRERAFLSGNAYPVFPRFIDEGDTDARPWYVMELLEEARLPSDDGKVADFILDILKCVDILHTLGFVHRDIKPGNIMRRPDGTSVLIDMGLLKAVETDCGGEGNSVHPLSTLSVIDGKAVGVGTPRYAAPEQFTGGEISPAADIHALGMLVNECFGGKPEAPWERIVARATSSIPERRYQDVKEFMRAVRRRHLRRYATVCAVAFSVIAAVLSACISCWNGAGRERFEWRMLAENITTNVVSKEVVSVSTETNDIGVVYPVSVTYRWVTNTVDIALIRLNGLTNVFASPLRLSSDRETWITGPGILDAAFACGKGGAKVRLENCLFNNRSRTPPAQALIRYELTRGVYLNFTEHDDDFRDKRGFIEPYDGAFNEVRFKGPETWKEFRRQKDIETRINAQKLQ